MSSKTIVITGASDGIGKAAAKELVGLGHEVIIVGRNPQKTKKVAEELNCKYYFADFADFSQVVSLAHELNKLERIDVLANNAGAVIPNFRTTIDRNEMTFQVNVLSPFLLTYLLLPKLKESHATVIQTSSVAANLFSRYDLDKLNITDFSIQGISYDAFREYGNAKLCNILFTRWLDHEYREKGINSVAFEPGVVRTNFGAEMKGIVKLGYHTPIKYLFTISSEKSAKRLVWLATSTADEDFECGKTYSKPAKEMNVKFEDPYLEEAQKLWNKCYSITREIIEKEK